MWKTEQDKELILYDKLHVLQVETDPDLLLSAKKDFLDLYFIIKIPDYPLTRKAVEITEEFLKNDIEYNLPKEIIK